MPNITATRSLKHHIQRH